MKPSLDFALSGFSDPAPRDYELRHQQLARQAAAEGMVLLKNEGDILPLAAGCRVALYGMGALHTIKGGTGSGDVNVRNIVSIAQGMRNAGFTLANEAWLNQCETVYQNARSHWRDRIWEKLETGEQPHFFAAYVNTAFRSPPCPKAEFVECDAVFYVLSRSAGEGADRVPGPGDWQLSEAEHHELKQLCELYPQIILVLNAGGMVDLSVLEELPQICAVLLISQPGMEGGNAFADVVSGACTPSGKLTDSWPLSAQDHPCMNETNRAAVRAGKVPYREGIYVGYRYFDSFEVPVRYSFGYGLSYTKFEIQVKRIFSQGGFVKLEVQIHNIGSHCGREVVQIYATCPLNGLHKEDRRLAAFQKTKLLAPGEAQQLEIALPAERLASYDPSKGSRLLESGRYILWAGASLADAFPVGVLHLEKTVLLEQFRRLWPDFDDVDAVFPNSEHSLLLRRSLDEQCERLALPVCLLKPVTDTAASSEVNPIRKKAQQIASRLSDEQLIRLCVGQWSCETESQLGAAGISIPGSAGETSAVALEYGIRKVVLADGPAGLRLNKVYFAQDGKPLVPPLEQCFEGGYLARSEYHPGGERRYQFCTAFPVGTLLAQSWDLELLYQVGQAVGEEMDQFGIGLWLAPGMNLHRDPLCGRNFEYYSEDPLVSGLAAAAVTAGVQSLPGRGVTIKHFACNNQEELRTESDSVVSERTLREIYLRSFEIAVKTAQPAAIMTGYNLVNGVHAANSAQLCTQVLREEWGFDGLVMTDWDTTSSVRCTPEDCIRAGNDLMMPGSQRECKALWQALQSHKLNRDALVRCAENVLVCALQAKNL